MGWKEWYIFHEGTACIFYSLDCRLLFFFFKISKLTVKSWFWSLRLNLAWQGSIVSIFGILKISLMILISLLKQGFCESFVGLFCVIWCHCGLIYNIGGLACSPQGANNTLPMVAGGWVGFSLVDIHDFLIVACYQAFHVWHALVRNF